MIQPQPLTRRLAVWLLPGLALAAASAAGQDYSAKPIRIVTAEAGGGSDFVSRIIGQGLSASWGKPVVVKSETARMRPLIQRSGIKAH